jgi:type 1 glutamine amidotransferase
MTNALYLYGGWPGHSPSDIAEWTRDLVGELGFDLEESQDIFTLDRDLTGYDLIILGWNNALTTEDLSDSQEDHLLAAVEAGTGIAAWHGAAAAFRSSLRYHLMLGGDFLAHPAGEGYPHPYEVNVIDHDHPVSHGVNDFSVASEQYYMSVDPNITVLAETTFTGEHFAWLDGTKSPVAWVRQWGDGRVFYHSIGHGPQDLAGDDVRRLTKQGIAWAARK